MRRRHSCFVGLGLAMLTALPTSSWAEEKAPVSTAKTPVALAELHRGMSFGFFAKNGYYGSSEGLAQPEKMAALGVKWVSVIVTVMQDAYYSTRVYKDFKYTPNDVEIEQIIDKIHQQGMRVMLYPNLEMHDSQWRGRVKFPYTIEQIQGVKVDYWAPWFDSYTDCLLNYARLAQRKNVELLCLGAEMEGTTPLTYYWERAIRRVREVYHGPLIYEAHGDELDKPAPWFSKLDLIGYSYYKPTADRPGMSVAEMVEFLKPTVARCQRFSEKVGKPLVFTEGGCLSRKGSTINNDTIFKPGQYQYSGEEQAQWMEAVWTAFGKEPWWRGLYWWKWDEQQNRPQYKTDPTGDQGCTIQGKPAEKTLKRIYSQTDRP